MSRAEDEWIAGLRDRLAAVERELEVTDAHRAELAGEARRMRTALAALQDVPGVYKLIRQYINAGPGPYTAAAGGVFFQAAGWDARLQGDPNRAALKALGQLHRTGELIIRTARPGVYRRRLPGE